MCVLKIMGTAFPKKRRITDAFKESIAVGMESASRRALVWSYAVAAIPVGKERDDWLLTRIFLGAKRPKREHRGKLFV